MPSYSNATPPIALYPGDVGASFSSETPADGTAGAQFALPQPAGFPEQGRAVRWQTIFASAPSAVSIALQGAIADVDAEYKTLDTSTQTAGEARTVAGVRAKFLRAVKTSSTGGGAITVKILP
jgi:hypothetical protein